MRRIERAAGALLLLAGMAVAGPAPAAEIFSDDFNRNEPSSVGNGWTETEKNSKDVAIVNRSGKRRLMLRDEIQGPIDAAAARTGISTVGYTEIVLSYEWAPLEGSESSDELHVQWRVGPAGTWQDVATHSLGGDGRFTSQSISLSSLAAGVADFELRFWTDVSDEDNGAYIDNVTLKGTAARGLNSPPLSVPEPGTLALLGLGLAGIAAVRRDPRARPATASRPAAGAGVHDLQVEGRGRERA